jgi:hypothetical protein
MAMNQSSSSRWYSCGILDWSGTGESGIRTEFLIGPVPESPGQPRFAPRTATSPDLRLRGSGPVLLGSGGHYRLPGSGARWGVVPLGARRTTRPRTGRLGRFRAGSPRRTGRSWSPAPHGVVGAPGHRGPAQGGWRDDAELGNSPETRTRPPLTISSEIQRRPSGPSTTRTTSASNAFCIAQWPRAKSS